MRPGRPDRPPPWTETTLLDERARCGQIRTRLKASSGITGWRFESASAHLETPRLAGFCAFRGPILRTRGELFAATPLATADQACSSAFSNLVGAPGADAPQRRRLGAAGAGHGAAGGAAGA